MGIAHHPVPKLFTPNKMKKLSMAAALCASALLSTSAQANVVTLNFDDVAVETFLNTAYAGLGVTFNAAAAVHQGAIGGVTSGAQFASGNGKDNTTALELTFDNYATSVGAYNVNYSFLILSVYDVNGLLLGSANTNNFGDRLFFSNVGQIKTAVFSTGLVYGIDDLSFETAVPEPASIALIGLGMLGVAATRRRNQQA
jgi:uncharacterized protein YraI